MTQSPACYLPDGDRAAVAAQLAEAITAGDADAEAWARWSLALSVHKLARKAAWRAAGGDPEKADDLAQHALIHLAERAHTWDPSRAKLTTWAGWYLKGAITRAPETRGEAVSTSQSCAHDYLVVRRVLAEGGTIEAAAEMTSRTPETLQALLRAKGRAVRLDAPLHDDGDITGRDRLPDSGDLADVQMDVLRQHARLEALLPRLPEREQLVMRHCMAGWSCAQVGREVGLSRERVRQLQVIAIKRLRAWLDDPAVLCELTPPPSNQEITMPNAAAHQIAGGAVIKARSAARFAALRIDVDNLAGAPPGTCIAWDRGARCQGSIKTRQCCRTHYSYLRKRGWSEVPPLTAEEYAAAPDLAETPTPTPEPPAELAPQVDELAAARERIAGLEADAAGVRELLEAAHEGKPMPLDAVRRELPLTYQAATAWAVVTNRILHQVGDALGECLGPEDDATWDDLLEVVRVLADGAQGGPTVTATLVEDLAVALGHAAPAHPTDYSEADLLAEVREIRRRPRPAPPEVAQLEAEITGEREERIRLEGWRSGVQWALGARTATDEQAAK